MPPNVTLMLAARVRDLMERRGWSQDETARRAQVSRRSVGYLVNYRDRGDRHPTLETVEAIASAFGMPVWRLLMPDEAGAPHVAEPEPPDTELLATVLAESADVFRSLNVMPNFKELAAAAVRMYVEVQTGIPMRRAAAQVTYDLDQIRRGINLAAPKLPSGGDSKRGQGNQGAAGTGKNRTR